MKRKKKKLDPFSGAVGKCKVKQRSGAGAHKLRKLKRLTNKKAREEKEINEDL